ncbi:nicotinate-nucleotide adenylyltransferase [Croceicoccus hydrothermalis]|uniref:nicotinate-nucleotide adenylyltransferase n=1 Tax=Croceicoccus hydrothermalis TaxID=2867964 RepID=UPI001EFA71F5|nr:nicotinate-nucleotide adenylyltransferase [Croceicoccus hydrothermalis]
MPAMHPVHTGLLGGSFNPAHGGHRRISLFAMDALRLDEVWWMVSPGNPLKAKAGMAPLPARLASARDMARGTRIRATAIEAQMHTRFTVDTLRALIRRYPRRRFVWLMGADNLAQFHRWREWRTIARLLPIAVIARPGYDAAALRSPAMAWLRRYRVSSAGLLEKPYSHGRTRSPAWAFLRFDPDSRSATAIRAKSPGWAGDHASRTPRDRVTHRIISQPKG